MAIVLQLRGSPRCGKSGSGKICRGAASHTTPFAGGGSEAWPGDVWPVVAMSGSASHTATESRGSSEAWRCNAGLGKAMPDVARLLTQRDWRPVAERCGMAVRAKALSGMVRRGVVAHVGACHDFTHCRDQRDSSEVLPGLVSLAKARLGSARQSSPSGSGWKLSGGAGLCKPGRGKARQYHSPIHGGAAF